MAECDGMDDLPVYSLLEAPEHGQGFSTLRIALSTNETEPYGFAAGEQVAVVARRNVSLASVVDGLACTHHRIEIDNPPARAGLLTIRVTPKVPPHAWQQIAVLPVRACHELLARHPDRGGDDGSGAASGTGAAKGALPPHAPGWCVRAGARARATTGVQTGRSRPVDSAA